MISDINSSNNYNNNNSNNINEYEIAKMMILLSWYNNTTTLKIRAMVKMIWAIGFHCFGWQSDGGATESPSPWRVLDSIRWDKCSKGVNENGYLRIAREGLDQFRLYLRQAYIYSCRGYNRNRSKDISFTGDLHSHSSFLFFLLTFN